MHAGDGELQRRARSCRCPAPSPGWRRRSSRRREPLNGATDPEVRADLINLDFHLDRADRWIEAGVIGGERSQRRRPPDRSSVALLLTMGDLAPRLDARPVGKLARRLFPEYPGSVPAGVLPREWLEARAP